MKLSFTTLGCPNWTIEQIAAQAGQLGFDGVDLRGATGEHIGPEETPDERRRIRQLFDDAGVQISGIMTYCYFTADDPVQREQNIQIAHQYLEVARDVGCPLLRVFGGPRSRELDDEGNLRRMAASIGQVAHRAEQLGVTIALETHDDGSTGAHVRSVLDAVDSPNLAACWDLANTAFLEPLEVTHAAIAGRIAQVHFNDATPGTEHNIACLLGEGEVGMRRALELLQGSGYNGYLAFEWEKKWQPEIQEPEIAFPHYLEYCAKLMVETGISRE